MYSNRIEHLFLKLKTLNRKFQGLETNQMRQQILMSYSEVIVPGFGISGRQQVQMKSIFIRCCILEVCLIWRREGGNRGPSIFILGWWQLIVCSHCSIFADFEYSHRCTSRKRKNMERNGTKDGRNQV